MFDSRGRGKRRFTHDLSCTNVRLGLHLVRKRKLNCVIFFKKRTLWIINLHTNKLNIIHYFYCTIFSNFYSWVKDELVHPIEKQVITSNYRKDFNFIGCEEWGTS